MVQTMNNLIIRRTEPSDAKGLHELYLNKYVLSQTLHLPLASFADWQDRLNAIPKNVYSLVALIDDEIVGNLGLTIYTNPRRQHVADFGMAVKSNFQSQGVGRALLSAIIGLADNWLGIKRLELTVYTDNQKAIALYQKFNFVIEGEAKNFALRDGEFVHAYYTARIKA